MKSLKVLSLAVAASLGTACTTFIPEYQRPDAPVPMTWSAAAQSAQPAEAVQVALASDLQWRDYFADPRLRDLIDLALEHNRDLRVAALNIEKARAQYRVTRADLVPGLDAAGAQNRQRVPADISRAGSAQVTGVYSAEVGLYAYELDFFGRVQALNEQALALYLGTEEAYKSVRNTLVAEVANAWLSVAANRELLELAGNTFKTRERSHELTRQSFDAGVVSAVDLSQSETSMARARVDAARQRAQLALAENALALLIGQAVPLELMPGRLDEAVGAVFDIPSDLPAEVLAERPDILAAEQQLRAANADIGAARAAFYPKITLTATVGTASASLDQLFGAGSGNWSFIPRITLPIFDAGRLEADLEVVKAQREIALANYEKAIQTAFREVADALAERATLAEQLAAQNALLKAAQDTHRLADARYRGGVDSYLTLLDAQRTLFGAEQEMITTRLSDASNRVAMYKVLGGGWK